MNRYRVIITATAVKEHQKLDVTTRQRIDKALQGLLENARPSRVKKLSDISHDWRIRVGDYRLHIAPQKWQIHRAFAILTLII